MITALSASVTLILGAVLGALPALLTGSWSDPQTRDQTWVLLGFTVASLAAAVNTIVLYRKRRWVLQQNGTAYVIRELASDWDRQDEKVFLDSADRYFARVIKVPGPASSADPGIGRSISARSTGMAKSTNWLALSRRYGLTTIPVRPTGSSCGPRGRSLSLSDSGSPPPIVTWCWMYGNAQPMAVPVTSQP